MTRDTAQDGAQDTEQDLPQGGAAPLPTLGERLDAQGRGLAARLLTPLPWAGPLRVFVDHAAGLVVCAGRFERVESAPDPPGPRVAAPAASRAPGRRGAAGGARRGGARAPPPPPPP
ncbi:hypothetical protein ACFXPJ_34910, partial [Streptomyces goshikiensis]